ncbi:hypothetical protein [Actinomycetospora cinnamomea]|uniref:Uncharacterized protein n=1 Tax=Actinomycetospora cinnamomea TaxID=663609 RepID=A0A2U1FIV8_9PSEU|nr:hypothetical protein [Actinomycetospora cinnamomea]PVZ12097.1 hypothetical protein C8D89_103428 [Actinomycetospora cinnamomea]
MLDSGVRIAAAFLPVGIPVMVGLVVAVLRRRALPAVSGPAIAGLVLQLVALLAATFIVAEGSLRLFGLSPQALLTVSSILGFAVIVLQVLSWTLLLLALFRRLPAAPEDRTPTGRHALLDDQGAQVIAEEGTTLLPVGAAAAGAGAGAGLGAAAASTRVERPGTSGPLPTFPVAPEREPEPAVTETFAVGPETPGADDADEDLAREEPPAVTAESLDEAATEDEETEDEAHDDVAETATADPDVEPEHEPDTTTIAATAPAEPTETETDVEPDTELEAEAEADAEADTAPDTEPEPEPALVAEVDADAEADRTELVEEPGDDPDDVAVTDTDETPDTTPDATAEDRQRPATSSSGGHPWFDPDGEAARGTSEQAGATRAGSAEGR